MFRNQGVAILVPFFRAKDSVMNITLSLAPLVSVIAGVLILIVPRLLNYIVAAYLIVVGLLGLFGDIPLR
jgi:flagellar biosynthesis protein FliQ